MEYEQYDIVKQLLDRGADVNAREYRVSTVALSVLHLLALAICTNQSFCCGVKFSR